MTRWVILESSLIEGEAGGIFDFRFSIVDLFKIRKSQIANRKSQIANPLDFTDFRLIFYQPIP
jgi:hypothetical protein